MIPDLNIKFIDPGILKFWLTIFFGKLVIENTFATGKNYERDHLHRIMYYLFIINGSGIPGSG